jgi:hypothetical protein
MGSWLRSDVFGESRRQRARVASLLLSLLGCGIGPASCQGGLRAFENANPERLSADTCWSKRQIEKEQYENLRQEHLSCEATRGRESRAPSALAELSASFTQIPLSECRTSPAANAPLKDRKTGLCTWQALAQYPRGQWVDKETARLHMGESPYFNYGKEAVGANPYCVSKRRWYRCPAYNHTREWLPELVRTGKCEMTYMTPPKLANITRRPLKVLLHGDSLFKATYKAFICQLNDYVSWEKHFVHPRHESKGAEVWVAGLGSELTLQYNYRDPDFSFTTALAVSEPDVLHIDEADVIVTNSYYGSGVYREMATRHGFNGPILGVSHACARCRSTTEAGMRGCADNSVKKLDCSRRAGAISIDYCTMTLPYGGISARWAPNGAAMNSMDPHMCSPGPDDQLMNHVLHAIASYFRRS